MDLFDFDTYVEDWCALNPYQAPPVGDLFAQWLSDKTGEMVIGGPLGEAPSVVAVPEEDA